MKKTISAFKAIRFFLNLRNEIIHTQCQLRMLRDEIRLSKSSPTIMDKTFLSVPEAAVYIDSTENFIKSLIKNHDIDSYQSPYKGYVWVRRTDLDRMIEHNKILSTENIKIAANNRKRK